MGNGLSSFFQPGKRRRSYSGGFNNFSSGLGAEETENWKVLLLNITYPEIENIFGKFIEVRQAISDTFIAKINEVGDLGTAAVEEVKKIDTKSIKNQNDQNRYMTLVTAAEAYTSRYNNYLANMDLIEKNTLELSGILQDAWQKIFSLLGNVKVAFDSETYSRIVNQLLEEYHIYLARIFEADSVQNYPYVLNGQDEMLIKVKELVANSLPYMKKAVLDFVVADAGKLSEQGFITPEVFHAIQRVVQNGTTTDEVLAIISAGRLAMGDKADDYKKISLAQEQKFPELKALVTAQNFPEYVMGYYNGKPGARAATDAQTLKMVVMNYGYFPNIQARWDALVSDQMTKNSAGELENRIEEQKKFFLALPVTDTGELPSKMMAERQALEAEQKAQELARLQAAASAEQVRLATEKASAAAQFAEVQASQILAPATNSRMSFVAVKPALVAAPVAQAAVAQPLPTGMPARLVGTPEASVAVPVAVPVGLDITQAPAQASLGGANLKTVALIAVPLVILGILFGGKK